MSARFQQRNVRPDYGGGPEDTVDIEIFEHWLEPAKSAAA
jgi:nitrile hydratase subunit beta